MTNIKAVCTDVDGTLLDSNHRLRDDVISCLHRLMAKGIKIIIATGRGSGQWIDQLRDIIGNGSELGKPAVLRHGRLVIGTDGEILSQTTLQNKVIKKLLSHDMLLNNGLVAHTTDSKTVIRNDPGNTIRRTLVPYGNTNFHEIGREFETIGGPDGTPIFGAEYILTPETDETLSKQREIVTSVVESEDAVVLSAVRGFIEIIAGKTTHKATGITSVLNQLNISPSEVISLGDGENDVEMLQLVRESGGISVAMGNAVPITKKVAEHIVANNDDGGWAEALEKFVLSK